MIKECEKKYIYDNSRKKKKKASLILKKKIKFGYEINSYKIEKNI